MKVAELRNKIDHVDNGILSLLKDRKKIIKMMAKAKKEEHLPISDPNREKEITTRLGKKFKEIDKRVISDLYKVIFNYSKKEMRK